MAAASTGVVPDDSFRESGLDSEQRLLPQVKLYLLCLSRGDYYGQGRRRVQELLASCKVLDISVSAGATREPRSPALMHRLDCTAAVFTAELPTSAVGRPDCALEGSGSARPYR